jgi:uncharacterized protein
MNINQILAEELKVKEEQVRAAVALIDEGNTIPFIARYRKEATGSLNDEVLRTLYDRLMYMRNLQERRETIKEAIREQGKLTEQLEKAIDRADTLVALEDLYRPYRPKRRTRASIAKEKGLEPLAALIFAQKADTPLEDEAKKYINEEKGVASAEEALAGARDIIAEAIADNAAFRNGIRNHTRRTGILSTAAKNPEEKTVYDMYDSHSEKVSAIPGHRILAINRGEAEKVLTVKIEVDEETVDRYLAHNIIRGHNPVTEPQLRAAIQDSYRRLIAPAIEREIRNELTERAQDGAIAVFGKNLTQLLMQPPIAGHVVLGWDPAFRTGCKLAVVDETGKVLDSAVIYPTAPTNERKQAEAKRVLNRLIDTYHVTLVSVGNGTASRESEQFLAEYLKESGKPVSYVITNEAGASVYSASALATEEFPQYDVGVRSAASIARRVQDPLAELVKIDPKSIGVGQYQHDMDQKKLGSALSGVVEACVNRVGVDLNTASAPLLERISGITRQTAKNIVAYREEHGRFDNRKELLKVQKLGPKAFEQCAGFMRITGGSEPLDATAVHPESYDAMKKLLAHEGTDLAAILSGKETLSISDYKQTAEELSIGEITLRDNVAELMKPGRDPRADMPLPILRSDVLQISDLKEGMILRGTVRNVIDFGAFVDIGVHEDGLVHISQMAKGKFVKHPLDVVSVGDIVEVKVIQVDEKKNRIGLSMIL